jgi:putative tryptophan/tyrosine transport system substrate-binding protein
VTILSGALTAKRLELLRELRPQASVACLVNPGSPEAETQLTDIREAARTTGKDLRLLNVSNDHDLDAAFATLVREQIGGFLVANDAFFVGRREQIVALAARHAIPAMYFLREFAAVGGLMSYATASPMRIIGSASPLGEFLVGASNRPTYRSSRRRRSSWYSTKRPLRHSA